MHEFACRPYQPDLTIDLKNVYRSKVLCYHLVGQQFGACLLYETETVFCQRLKGKLKIEGFNCEKIQF